MAQFPLLRDAFDVSVEAVIKKLTKLRDNLIAGITSDEYIEELSWKYALLEEGETLGVHEWDSFFSKPKRDDGDTDLDGFSVNSTTNSLIYQQKQHT